MDLIPAQLINANGESVSKESLKGKFVGIYFSAHWCGPCRRFTPQLAEFYRQFKAGHPELELIFVSSDHSEAEMEAYMREAAMPWPAIQYRKVRSASAIRKYAGRGIPCLVLVDPDGKVLSHSYDGDTYVGPGKVVADIQKLVGNRN